jgi:hypothetical protein
MLEHHESSAFLYSSKGSGLFYSDTPHGRHHEPTAFSFSGSSHSSAQPHHKESFFPTNGTQTPRPANNWAANPRPRAGPAPPTGANGSRFGAAGSPASANGSWSGAGSAGRPGFGTSATPYTGANGSWFGAGASGRPGSRAPSAGWGFRNSAPAPGGQPGAVGGANPNAPVIFLVPTRGLGSNGMPKLIQLPTMYSMDVLAACALDFVQKSQLRVDFL